MLSDILLHPTIIIPSVICVLLPWNVYIRLCLWVGLLLAMIFILISHNSFNETAFLSFIFIAFHAAIVMLPAGIAQYLFKWTIAGRPPQFALYSSDRTFMWAIGLCGIIILFVTWAFYLPEAASAFVRHFILFAFPFYSLYRRRFVFASLAMIVPLVSLYHAVIVQRAAEDAAQGHDYCLYLNQRKEFAESWQQLTFMTMDKGDFSPHAYIIIETDPPTYGYWSYTQQKFDTTWQTQFADPSLTCPTD